MKEVYVVVLLLLVSPSLALTDSVLEARELTLDVSLSNTIDIESTGSRSEVLYVKANLTWLPQTDYRQEVLSSTSSPKAEKTSDALAYTWTSPTQASLPITYNAKIKTNNQHEAVIQYIPFPLEGIPQEYHAYLQPAEIIDITPEIRAQAARIAQGKNDAFEVAYALADWSRTNVEYDLTTVTAEASQQASWVLKNRRGVCDELTSLFIAMSRSLGIPARFISGVSYTNLEVFEEPFSPHGWAEVYLPGAGWVPFDVTYGEYGYVDSTHIKFQESIDAKASSLTVLSKGRNIKILTKSFDVDVKLVDEKPAQPFITATLEPLRERVGFTSYNVLKATVKNTHNHYAVTNLHLSRTEGLSTYEHATQAVLLKPLEEKTVFFLIQVQDDLDRAYEYTFPISMTGDFMKKTETRFKSDAASPVLSLSDAESLADITTEDTTSSSEKLLLACNAQPEVFYEDQQTIVTCSVTNSGEERRSVQFCIEHSCQAHTLNPQATAKISEEMSFPQIGFKTIEAEVYDDEERVEAFILINVLEYPRVYIENVTGPETIIYGGSGNIEALLRTETPVQDVTFAIEHDILDGEWEFSDMPPGLQAFTLSFDTQDLNPGRNDFLIRAEYKDAAQNKYTSEETVTVILTEVSPGDWVKLKIHKFWVTIKRSITSLF